MTKNRILLPLLLLVLLFAAGVVHADTVYVVQPGDTLFNIALRFGVSMEAIAAANNLTNLRLVYAGQSLVIPGIDAPTPAPVPPVAPRPYVVPASAVATEGGVIHTVAPGDTLFRVSMTYNILMDIIAQANNLSDWRYIYVGQQLFIPGASLDTPSTVPSTPATPQPAPVPIAPAPVTNLFKNPSFEGDWYFHIYNELQVPVGWQLTTDEGPNTLDPGSGGLFNRPEVRVVGRDSLPEDEWPLFIFDGDKTIKAFKGGAPTSFSLFQDVYLAPGRYRMTLNFFPDTLSDYAQGGIYTTEPLAAEVSIIHNTGGLWTAVPVGQKVTRFYEFTMTQAGAARLGASFRGRFVMANNGWFIDDWRLERIGN